MTTKHQSVMTIDADNFEQEVIQTEQAEVPEIRYYIDSPTPESPPGTSKGGAAPLAPAEANAPVTPNE